ncbi:MAG: hypothetical protein ABI978_02315 [Chloroflexota bacterium]
MPSPARRLAAIVVLFLSLAIVAVLGLRAIGLPVGSGPMASATPIVATGTAKPSGPLPSQDMLAVLAQIEKEVRDLRGLPAAEIGSPDVLTRAELAKVLPGLLKPALDNATLRALGLLTGDQDIVALTTRLYTEQVLGFYDFDTKRMVIVSDSGLTPAAKITYAHEYTHALQDAAFDAGAAQKRVDGQRDRELALLSLEEGDATTVMVLWAIAHLSADELAGVTETPLPAMTGIPAWMVRLLEVPYLSGASFVGQLRAPGGWDGVNAAYSHLPASTEQVLHPQKYIDAEAATQVRGLDLWGVLRPDWAHASDTSLGEEWMAIWLEGIGVPRAAAENAAAGWGGDHLTVATNPDGRWALGWRIAWDAPLDATEFEASYAGVRSKLPFATKVVHVSDRETVVLQASSAQLLDSIATLIGS